MGSVLAVGLIEQFWSAAPLEYDESFLFTSRPKPVPTVAICTLAVADARNRLPDISTYVFIKHLGSRVL